MFDRVEIIARGGNGGNGIVSFRREKFVPFGGPNGGDGGKGGDIIVMVDSGISSLRLFQRKRFFRAADGDNGKGKEKYGKRGEDLVLRVPIGTMVSEKTDGGNGMLLADLEQSGQKVVVAKGGRGGWGNTHFVSSINQAPRMAQKGEAGEENSMVLELRLIADVGLIGYPNVGKSTLLAAISAAKPKIASYPFTTLEPVLGVVEVGQKSFVLAEIPGLIEGAHLGRGLGHDFLRHILRTKVLIHLIDGSSTSPVEDMIKVNNELNLFDAALGQKPQMVVVNKVDLPQVQAQLPEIRDAFNAAGVKVLFISAATGQGIAELKTGTMKLLSQSLAITEAGKEIPQKVFRPQPKDVAVSVHKEGDAFVVIAPDLEQIVARMDMTNPEVLRRFQKQFTRRRVSQALGNAGIQSGDKVRCGNFEWEW
ncbi:MAG: GTPase ObgE [Chloroflexota bacterium]